MSRAEPLAIWVGPASRGEPGAGRLVMSRQALEGSSAGQEAEVDPGQDSSEDRKGAEESSVVQQT